MTTYAISGILSQASFRPIKAAPPSVDFALADFQHGVNLSGLQLGTVPGVRGTDYPSLRTAELDYWLARGINSFRICTKWERWQSTLNGPLDGTDHIDHIHSIVDHAAANGGKCLIDFHNYGGRLVSGTGRKIGDAELPLSAYEDFARKVAAEFDGDPGILGIDMMNEPNGIPVISAGSAAEEWANIAQAFVDAYREVGMQNYLFVPGYFFNKHTGWSTRNTTMHLMTDPANRLVFSAHAYFDSNTSGTYTDETFAGNGAYDALGFDAIDDFLGWLSTYGFTGHIGEWGAPGRHETDGGKWRVMMDAFAQRCFAAGVLSHFWSAGEWWSSSYALRATPTSGFPATSPDPADTQNGLMLMDLSGHFDGNSTLSAINWSIAADSATPDEGTTVTYTVSWTGGSIKQGERAVISFSEGGTATGSDWTEGLTARLQAAATGGANDDGLVEQGGDLIIHSGVTSPVTITRTLATGTAGKTHDLTIAVDVGTVSAPTASITVQDAGAASIVQTNLIAEWRFDENAGTVVNDYGPNNLDLSFGTAAPTWTVEGLSFPNNDSWAASPTMPSRVRGFDIVFKVNSTITPSSSGSTVFGRGDAANDHDGLRLGSVTGLVANEIICIFQDNETWVPNYSGDHRASWSDAAGSLAAGWHMLQCDYDDTIPERWRMYLDGTRITALDKSGTPEPFLLVPFHFGRSASGNGMDGVIGYVNFYSLERGDADRNTNRQAMIDAMSARGVTLP